MKETIGKAIFSKRLIVGEIIAFALIIIMIWVDEIFDIPHLFLGAAATPINWRESLIETLFILPLGLLRILSIRKTLKRFRHLTGSLPICASCKKIRDDQGSWHPMETFIRDRSEARFSHGICPTCAEKLYPEVFAKNHP